MSFLFTATGVAPAYKRPVRAASTAPLSSLSGSGALSIDGVTLVDKDRVLLKDQGTAPVSDASQNGIYVVSIVGGNWSLVRATDANASHEIIPGMIVPVAEGSTQADEYYQLTTDAPITVGTTALTFVDILQAIDDATSSNVPDTLVKRDASGSFAAEDITAENSLIVDASTGTTSTVSPGSIVSVNTASGEQSTLDNLELEIVSPGVGETLTADSGNVILDVTMTANASLSASILQFSNPSNESAALSASNLSLKKDSTNNDGLVINTSTSGVAEFDGFNPAAYNYVFDFISSNTYPAQLKTNWLTLKDNMATEVTIVPVNGTSSYSIALPSALPAATSALLVDSSGFGSFTEVTDQATASTIASRDSSGNSSFNQVEAVTFLSNDGASLSAQMDYTNGVQVTNTGTANSILNASSLQMIANSGNSAASMDANNGVVSLEDSGGLLKSVLSPGKLELYADKNSPYPYSLTIDGTISDQVSFTLLDTGVLDPYFYFTAVNNPNTWVQGNNFKADSGYGSSIAITPTGLALTNNSQTLTINSNPAATGTYSITLPPDQGGAGTALLNDGSGNLSWGTAGMANPMTTAGDIIVGGASGTPARLALGTVDKVLVSNGTTVSYQYAGLGGGALGANNVILGSGKPTSFAGTKNVYIGTDFNSTQNTTNTILIGWRNNTAANGDNSVLIGSSMSGNVGGSANSVVIGQDITVNQNTYEAVVIGRAVAKMPGYYSVVIGNRSSGGGNNTVVVGDQASVNGGSIALGCSISVTGAGAIGIGNSTSEARSVAIGSYTGYSAPEDCKFYFGGTTRPIGWPNNTLAPLYFRRLSFSSVLNTSAAGGTWNFEGAQGTGTGIGGDLIFSIAPAGASGSTVNPQVEMLRVSATKEVKLSGGLKVKSIHLQTGTANVITATIGDYYIGVDCSANAITIALPAAATAGAGKQYVFKDESGNAGTNNITIDPNGAELIDGAATYVMAVNRESVTIICDGTNWFII